VKNVNLIITQSYFIINIFLANPALNKIESNFCNRFDLTNSITDDVLSKAQKHHFNLEKYSESNILEGILEDIKQLLKSEFSSTIPADPSQPRKILRVAINSLGSPFYNNGPLPFAEVYQFLTQLKGLMRFSYATLMVTLPAYIYSPSYLVPIYHLFDSVISLDTFTQEQAALAASGHHGFFRLVKSPSINTIQPSTSKILQSNHNNFVFKLSRKQFTIEPYVLPPELGDSPASSGCSPQNPSQNISSDILENFSQNKPSSQPKRITSHLGFNNNGNSKKSLDF
jgi:elongator complex protein 4